MKYKYLISLEQDSEFNSLINQSIIRMILEKIESPNIKACLLMDSKETPNIKMGVSTLCDPKTIRRITTVPFNVFKSTEKILHKSINGENLEDFIESNNITLDNFRYNCKEAKFNICFYED